VLARQKEELPAAGALTAPTTETADSPAPVLARFAVLRDEASDAQPEPEAAAFAEEPAEKTPDAPSFEAHSETPALVQRVMRFFRPQAPQPEAVAPPVAAAPTAGAASRTEAPTFAPIVRTASTPEASPPAETLSALAVARMQLPSLARAESYDEPADEDVAKPSSAASTGDLVLRQTAAVAQRWDAGPSATGAFAAIAPSMVEISREATPLVYRRSAFAAPPSSQPGGESASFEPSSAAIEQVLRQVERGGSIHSTISAPAAYVQRQLADETGADAATPMSEAAPSETPAVAAAPASPAAVPPAEVVAAISNQALERLAREIFDRLRRRLVVERERAGIGTALS
jgi:hypothetical protein